MVDQSDESDNDMLSTLKNERCKRPWSDSEQSGHARAHKKVCYEDDSNGEEIDTKEDGTDRGASPPNSDEESDTDSSDDGIERGNSPPNSDEESDTDSSDDEIERGASPPSPAPPAAPCNDSGAPFNAVLTKGTTQVVANGSNNAEKKWSSEDSTLPFTARIVEAHLCTKVAKSVPMHEGDDSFDGFGTGLVLRKAFFDCVAPAVAKAVLEKARLEQNDTAQANDTATDDTDICGGDGRTEATYDMLRAFHLAKGGDPDKVDAASEEELRNELEFIPRTAVDELAKNELYKVSVAYPATLNDASIVDGSTAKMVLPQLKCVGESGDHKEATTTTFFKNRLVAPGGRLFTSNLRCHDEATLEVKVCWHKIGKGELIMSIQCGEARLFDGDKLVSQVTGIDMSFARTSEYKAADVRRLQKRYKPAHCYSLVHLPVVACAGVLASMRPTAFNLHKTFAAASAALGRRSDARG